MDIDFDLSEVEAACKAFGKGLVDVAHHSVEAAAKAGVNEAVTRRRYKNRTGLLSQLAQGRALIRLADGAVGEMKWPVPYASYVDAGTEPHLIEGRRGGKLIFMWKGRLFIGPRVNHPGTRAYGFAGLAYHKAEAVLYAKVDGGAVAVAEQTISK